MNAPVSIKASLEDYRSIWWVTTVGSWTVATILALSLAGWGSAPQGMRDSTFFVALDALHHLGHLSPVLALALARRTVRRAQAHSPPARWILTGATPFWSIGIILMSLLVTAFMVAIGSGPAYGSYGSWLLIPVFVIARLALEIFWFRLCFRDAERIAVLEKTDEPEQGRAFRLNAIDKPIQYVVVRECDDVTSSVYLIDGDSEVLWKTVGPIEDLALAVRALAAGTAGKKSGL